MAGHSGTAARQGTEREAQPHHVENHPQPVADHVDFRTALLPPANRDLHHPQPRTLRSTEHFDVEREARHQLLQALTEIDRALDAAPVEAARESARFAIPDLGKRSPELQEARELIDELDRELVSLLARRATLAQRAGKAKAELGHPIVDPEREARLLAERRAWAEALHLDPESVEELFRAILLFSRRAQREPGTGAPSAS